MVGEPTVSKTPVVREIDPLVPAMPISDVPSSAPTAAVKVSVADPVPGPMKLESNVAVTPAGKPNTTRLAPLMDVAVTVRLTDVFRSNLCEPGNTLKSNPDGEAFVQAVIARYTFNLPPVDTFP